MKALRFILLVIFGGLFIYAGLMKAWRPMVTPQTIVQFAPQAVAAADAISRALGSSVGRVSV